RRFVAALSDPGHNQLTSAREAADKFNNAVRELNAKLVANNYQELEDWHGEGLGDTTALAKYLVYNEGPLASAVTAGFVAPTGRVDDPDILNDIAFGDGQWDIFSQVAFDQTLNRNVFFNQYAKYTWQLPSEK